MKLKYCRIEPNTSFSLMRYLVLSGMEFGAGGTIEKLFYQMFVFSLKKSRKTKNLIYFPN